MFLHLSVFSYELPVYRLVSKYSRADKSLKLITDNYLKCSSIESGVVASTPPSTGSVTPVIQRDSSLARNSAAQAMSHALPSMPSGVLRRRRSRPSSESLPATIGVYRGPGAMQFTRTPSRP